MERAVTHLVGLSAAQQSQTEPESQGKQMPGHEGQQTHAQPGSIMYPVDDPDKKQVPGYPQDMWMDMAEWVPEKPEFYGLRPTWDRAMMGMMTVARVLEPERYREVSALVRKAARLDSSS